MELNSENLTEINWGGKHSDIVSLQILQIWGSWPAEMEESIQFLGFKNGIKRFFIQHNQRINVNVYFKLKRQRKLI